MAQGQDWRREAYDRLRDEGKTHEEAVSIIEGSKGASGEWGAKPPVNPHQRMGELALTAAQGLPLVGTFTDEALGTVAGALSPSMTMQQGRDKAREVIAKTRERNPLISLGSEVAAGGAGIGALAKHLPAAAARVGLSAIPKGATLGQKAARAGKAGAILGGAAGLGAGEGTVERLPGAVGGAAIGGGLGAGVAAGAHGLGKVGAFATKKVKEFKDARDPGKLALRELAQNIDADQTDLSRLAQTAQPGATVSDVAGPYTAQRVRAAAELPTPEGTAFRQRAAQKAGQREGTVERLFAKETGVDPATGNLQAAADIDDALLPEVRKRYDDIMGQFRTLDDPRLQAMLRQDSPDTKAALAFAEQMYQKKYNRPIPSNARGEKKYRGLETFDYVKRGFDRLARAPDPEKSVFARGKAEEMRNLLDELVPNEYAAARELDAERRLLQRATALGEKLGRGRLDPRDWKLMLKQEFRKSTSPEAQKNAEVALREAAGREWQHRLAAVGEEGKKAIKMFGSKKNRELARIAFPDQRSFDAVEMQGKRLLESITREQAQLGNPKAIELLADPDAFGRMTPWSVAQALKGSPMLAVAQAAGEVHRQGAKKAEQEASRRILQMVQTPLAKQDPMRGNIPTSELQALLAELHKARQGFPSTRRPLVPDGMRRRSGQAGYSTLQAILGRGFSE